jgi:hypothetical protein
MLQKYTRAAQKTLTDRTRIAVRGLRTPALYGKVTMHTNMYI